MPFIVYFVSKDDAFDFEFFEEIFLVVNTFCYIAMRVSEVSQNIKYGDMVEAALV